MSYPYRIICIDDFFMLGHNRQQIPLQYDKVWNPFFKHKLPPKPKTCVEQSNHNLDVLGIQMHPHVKMEAAQGKMIKVIERTKNYIHVRVWNLNSLQKLLGSWNWFLLLNQPTMPIVRICYDLTASKKVFIKPSPKVRYELGMPMALARLLHTHLR